MKKVRQKLQSQRGESIAETLIAALVIALGLIMLVSMVMASARMVQTSKKTLDGYYQAKNNLEEKLAKNQGTETEISIDQKTEKAIQYRGTDPETNRTFYAYR